MTYWLCTPHRYSKIAFVLVAVVSSSLMITSIYSGILLLILMIITAILCHRALRQHTQNPCGISYHKDHWRCYYPHQIIPCELRKGFVIGPLAIMQFSVLESTEAQLLICFLLWDIRNNHNSQAANWNQLRTVLRYSQQRHPTKHDLWLSG